MIEELLADRPVDFIVLCSSLASQLGGFGQADYAGANAFLDAWARSRCSAGRSFTVSVNWDTWSEAGMAVETVMPGDLEAARQQRLAKGLSSREGVEAFRRILRERLPQVLVARGDFEARFLGSSRTPVAVASPRTAGSPSPQKAAATARHGRPALPNPYVPPRDDVERTVAGIWGEFLGFGQIGANDSFFDLGGHSLVATQIVNRLRDVFQVRLSLERLFEAPTIAALAEALLAGERRPGQVLEIARAVQSVEDLSPEDTLRLLEEAQASEGGR